MKISIIVAKALNHVIGKDNGLIWKLSGDMRHFKQTTTGHHIIMGRKTYESMGKPLPNRTSVVITRNEAFSLPENHHVVHSVEAALKLCREKQLDKVYVIGGADIYRQTLPFADEMIITEVKASPEGDVFFPEFSEENWNETEKMTFPKDEKNEHEYAIITYRRV